MSILSDIVVSTGAIDEDEVAKLLAPTECNLANHACCIMHLALQGVTNSDLRVGFRWQEAVVKAHNLRAQRFWSRRMLQRIAEKIDAGLLLPPVVPTLALGALVLLTCLASPGLASESVPPDHGPFVNCAIMVTVIGGACLLTYAVEKYVRHDDQ